MTYVLTPSLCNISRVLILSSMRGALGSKIDLISSLPVAILKQTSISPKSFNRFKSLKTSGDLVWIVTGHPFSLRTLRHLRVSSYSFSAG